MPINKQDATRALELLEQYQQHLNTTEDARLRAAIERVVKIFKSRLFNALIEIQEFYEVTLLDETKSLEQKALETQLAAERWTEDPAQLDRMVNNSQRPAAAGKAKSKPQVSDPAAAPVAATPDPAGGAFQLTLYRHPGQGFGFSIAGGADEPHLPGDTRIYVTKVVPGGAAAADGRMEVGDAILAVNGLDVTSVSHSAAVTALKLSDGELSLLVLRPPPPPLTQTPGAAEAAASDASDVKEASVEPDAGSSCVELTLVKTAKGLGFSIAGGTDNRHLPGDDAIFVTKVIEGGAAQRDGRMAFGDRLLAVDGRPLAGCTHAAAVAALKATGDRVRLTVAKATPEELRTLLELDELARMEELAEAEAAAANANANAHHRSAAPANSRQGGNKARSSLQDAYHAGHGSQELQDETAKTSKGHGGLFGKKKR